MLEDLSLHDEDAEDRLPNPLEQLTWDNMDLQSELVRQMNWARNLFTNIEYDSNIPPNQKAAVLNTLSSVIKQITSTQVELHNAQAFKKMEDALISSLKRFPDLQDAFYQAYEAELTSE